MIDLSLSNMPQPMIEPPILNKIMIEPKSLPSNQEQTISNPLTISYKRPQDNQISPTMPPKIK